MKPPWFDGDAHALAGAIVRGECSAVQALQRTLADVDAMNARLNAVCLLRPDPALARAAALDAELARCADDAAREALLRARPFFGVPLLLKDLGPAVAHRELPSRLGSRAFGPHGLEWPVDGALAERYVAAGFVPFGRTTSPEMGISASTEALAYGGPTRNPWNPERSAGGSSGGAAAATASGMVTIAHANDGAGSIRIPASACGLIGLKPSRGLMPAGPLVGEGWGGLAIDHVVTRSVRDCALALDATAGADPGAPYAAPAHPASFAALLSTPPKPLRIALCNGFFEGDAVDAEVAAAIDGFALALQRLGHAVEPARPGFSTLDIVQPVMQVIATGTAMLLDGLGVQRGRAIDEADLEPVVRGAWRTGRTISGTDYMRALDALHRLGRRMAAFHERYDVLLTPTLAEPPAVLGRFAMRNPDFIDYRLGPEGLWRYTPFTPLANATGAPSISLPVALSRDALPIGALLTAPPGADALLLQLAAQWEAAVASPPRIAPVSS
ncbi:MAG TPA: amidase family protein [Burkholderiaceae bacterium]|nr:amidase family protein [Burkholderiaceae bacterium]